MLQRNEPFSFKFHSLIGQASRIMIEIGQTYVKKSATTFLSLDGSSVKVYRVPNFNQCCDRKGYVRILTNYIAQLTENFCIIQLCAGIWVSFVLSGLCGKFSYWNLLILFLEITLNPCEHFCEATDDGKSVDVVAMNVENGTRCYDNYSSFDVCVQGKCQVYHI